MLEAVHRGLNKRFLKHLAEILAKSLSTTSTLDFKGHPQCRTGLGLMHMLTLA